MKRYICISLAIILCCLALASCGGSSEKDDDNSTIDNTASNETTNGADDIDQTTGSTDEEDQTTSSTDEEGQTTSGTNNSQTETNPTYEILEPYTLYCNQLLLDGGPQLTTLQAAPIPEELYQYCLQSGSSSDEASNLNFDEEKARFQIENELSAAYGDSIYKIDSITPTLISLPNNQFAYLYVVYTLFTDGEGFMCNGTLCYAWGGHGFEFLIIAE